MRIHVQNLPGDPQFAVTPLQWDAAAARAPDVSAGHAVTYGETPEEFRAAIGEAEALVAQTGAVRRLFPADAPRLKLIYCTSAGLDALAPFDRLPPGAALLNNRGTHGAKAGEYGIMALLMLATGMPGFATAQRAGQWAPRHGSVLAGRRVTVAGLGTLGGAVAEQAARFGMRVTGVRTRAEPHPACVQVVALSELDTVLGDTEFLVLALPLTDATRGVLDRRRIALLPSGAGVVNIGRGALLDQDALCDALEGGHLSGAILDVFVPEPVPPGHRLWTTPNLMMTPHISADDPDTYVPLSLDIFFQNLRAFRDGKVLPNQFDTVLGY
jgi:phosphoglycerate dehydrogenase-like enzyme